MEEELDFSNVPLQYALCLNRQCPKATTCLRQLAEKSAPNTVEYWSIISPKHLSTIKDNCPYYRSATKVRFAKGFIGILENLPHKQMQTVISRLMSHFSERTYYRIRKGERVLSPSEQQEVLRIIKRCGATMPLEFDAYYEDYDW